MATAETDLSKPDVYIATTRQTRILDPSEYHKMTKREKSIRWRIGASVYFVCSVISVFVFYIMIAHFGAPMEIQILYMFPLLANFVPTLYAVEKYEQSLYKKYGVKYMSSL